MSGYGEQEVLQQSLSSGEGTYVGLRPDPNFEAKLEEAAAEVATNGTKLSRLKLAGIASIDISFPPIQRAIYKLEDLVLPLGYDRLDIAMLSAKAEEEDDRTRAIAYAAFVGIGPHDERHSLRLRPDYDYNSEARRVFDIKQYFGASGLMPVA